MNKNAAPPFSPAMYGNFQIFPRPTADPAAAKMKLVFELHCYHIFLSYLLQSANLPAGKLAIFLQMLHSPVTIVGGVLI